MPDYEITDNSIIEFHHLFRGQEEDGLVVVGRQDIGSYVRLPFGALEIIDLLNSGKTFRTVKKILEAKYNEEVEIRDFVNDMIENEMVKSIDGFEIPTKSQLQKDLFKSITQKHVKWLFSKYAWIIYGVLAVMSLLIFVVNPHYIPNPRDFFFHPWLSIAVIVWFLFGWVLVAYHEMGHLFAARAVGTEGYFSMSNQLIFVVARTNLGNIWTVPRKKRYEVYLAGMAWDTVALFVCLVMLLLSDYHIFKMSVLWYKFVKSLVFTNVWGIIWQFRFNMKTDIYYVVTNYFKCRNLLQDAQAHIKNYFIFVKRFKKTDFIGKPETEMRAIKWYTPLYFLGTSVTLATFFLRTLPIFWIQVMRAVDGITAGYAANPKLFLDGIVIIVVSALNFGFLGFLILRPRWSSVKGNIRAVFASS